MIQIIGTFARPYTHAPPGIGDDGMPWGAFCRCARCGCVSRSTNGFDFYGEPGAPLVCGNCTGIDSVPPEWAIAFAGANPDFCDPLGPGCRGGYVESMARPVEEGPRG